MSQMTVILVFSLQGRVNFSAVLNENKKNILMFISVCKTLISSFYTPHKSHSICSVKTSHTTTHA